MLNTKKLFIRFIMLLLAIIILTGCGRDNVSSKKSSFDLSELIGNENIEDISLTIYYMSPYILTVIPLSVDHLINGSDSSKTVISDSSLEEHIDLFKQINNDDLIPVKKKSYLNARLYYVLESKKNGKLLDVAMWGGENNSIFVNGIEVKDNDIFYDLIMPLLPEDEVEELEKFIKNGFRFNRKNY